MRIVVFSLGVVFRKVDQGGSQKVLRTVMKGLGNRGHEVDIFCPRRDDNFVSFALAEGVWVHPVLKLGGSFPLPYAVSPFDLCQVQGTMKAALKEASLLYCHDGGLLIDGIKHLVPTVYSLRDFCYPETLLGAMNCRTEAVIVNSDHTLACLKDSFLRLNFDYQGEVFKIYNGFDSSFFKKTPIDKGFLGKYALPEKDDRTIVVGFPHRPQLEKGFIEAIRIIAVLSKRYEKIRILIPRYMDIGLSSRCDDTYSSIMAEISSAGIGENVIFHPWIQNLDMPQYYSYCDLVLCIGRFTEAFSNVAVESLLCETPVVATKVATYRSMPITEYLHLADPGDLNQIASIANEIIESSSAQDSIHRARTARSFIEHSLTNEKCIDGFEHVFMRVANGLLSKVYDRPRLEAQKQGDRFYRLSAWCSSASAGIYDDYKGYCGHNILSKLFAEASIISEREIIASGVEKREIEQAIHEGLLLLSAE